MTARPALRSLSGIFSSVGRCDRWIIGAAVAVSVAERLAILAAAFAGRDGHSWILIAVFTGAFAVLLLAGRALRGLVVRRVRGVLVKDVVRSVFSEEFLLWAPPAQGDELGTVLEGLHLAPQLAGEIVPALAANVIASLVLLPVALHELPVRVITVGALAMTAAALVVVGVTAATAAWATAAHDAFDLIQQDLATALGARLEIVANARDEEFEATIKSHVDFWLRESFRGDIRMALAGRAPTVAAFMVATITLLFDGSPGGFAVTSSMLGDAFLLASFAPVVAGLLRGPLDLARALARSESFSALLSHLPHGRRVTGAVPPRLPAQISWVDLSFSYAPVGRHAHVVLRNFSGQWLRGAVMGVTGPNGSGKSTFLRLLLQVGRPQRGAITADGIPLSHMDLVAWRRSIAYLPQRPFFPYSGSIRDAVRMLAPDASDESIRSALIRVDLWRDLSGRQPDDPLGTRLYTLSVGQRQRLALARILCQDASILLLDEPDANLDLSGIALVSDLIREQRRTRMVAFAAHTPQLLQVADTIVTVPADDGASRESPSLDDQESSAPRSRERRSSA